MNIRRIAHLTAVLCLAVSALGAQAQTWPSRPIRLVFPSAAGGGPERVIRAITAGLTQRLGQPVVIDYKAGAGGTIGTADLARAAPDGYTWMLAPETTLTINPLVYRNPGFKVEDVVPVSLIGSLTQALACHPSVGARNVQELVARAKTRDLTYASAGAGSAAHMTMEMFLEATQTKMTHIPYRGVAPAVQDLMAGQVDCYFGVVSALSEFIKSGRVVGVAVSPRKRVQILPDLATVQEQGVKDFDAAFYLGVFGPRGVPQDILAKFTRALDETVRSSEVLDAMAANAVTPENLDAQAAQKELRDIARAWTAVARRVNLKAE
jgi:tripartite-type tricarboxylate transporter receptor subunit TctC